VSVKFSDLAYDAYLKIGYLGAGEIMNDADAELALRVANVMLDSWSLESLSCFATITQSFVLVPNIGEYSIGPGGAIPGPRPTKINSGYGNAWTMDPSGNRYNLEVVEEDRWNILTSATTVNANVPDYLWYDTQFPLGFINVWPLPNINWTTYFYSLAQLTEFATIASTFSFPPGYQKAIQDCLAVELWPYCFKAECRQDIVAIASKSKGNIKRANIREVIAAYDPELISKSDSYYNVYTDSNN
jgi:hypothetical protein